MGARIGEGRGHTFFAGTSCPIPAAPRWDGWLSQGLLVELAFQPVFQSPATAFATALEITPFPQTPSSA